MLFPFLVTALALLYYVVITVNVGRARRKYGIKAPAITGNEDFERVFRVQQNTVEQLVLFLPALWAHTFYVGPWIASSLGALWLVGRILYARGYYRAAQKRMVGFALSMGASVLLLLGAFVGIIYRFTLL